MTLENLRQNIEQEKEILEEIFIFSSQLKRAMAKKDEELLEKTINSLVEILDIINKSLPLILENISPVMKLGKAEEGKEEKGEVKNLIRVSYEKFGERKYVTINADYRKKFIKELSLSAGGLKKLKEAKVKEIRFKEFKKPSFYAKISNRFFFKISNRLIEKGHFKNLDVNLRKANMAFLLNTYVSMVFFSTLLSVFFALVLFIFLIFFSFSIDFPFIIPAVLTAQTIVYNILACLAVPVIVFICFYFYPYTEKQSMGKKIDQELPFAAIHMSAIAGSGIEPSQIFKIIALGKEYPNTKQEIKKVINQVNVYGYDLVNSLKNSARTASSNKLAELFNGLATTISSGGSLTEFLDKRAESLLFDYKLDREKSTKVAETFMDIYISVVIAAPMIMMLLLILISVSRISIGLSLNALTAIIIAVVALINLIFLIFLHLKQPVY